MRYLVLISTFLSTVTYADGEVDYSDCHSQPDSAEILDSAFSYVNTKLCEPAIWFDSFFVDERVDQDARASSTVRWRNDFSYVEGEGYKFKTRFKARFHLPKVTKRLKVVFESDEEDDLFDLFPQTSEDAENTFGLRYDWLSKERYSFNVKVNARPGIEGRFRYTYPINDEWLLRVTQKLYQKKSVTGESTDIDLDYSINRDFLLRWSNYAQWESDIKGWEVGTGFTLYQHISDHQALSYQLSTTGTNRPFHYITNTHASVTYRQNVWRTWLFYELIPEYNWNREEDTQREGEAKMTFRLEILFNNI
ncbi:hypothetical protein [Vibrio europaeus]|uniref:hypothetical protein n=1 Tax=Vibrio europaeus TaxID=300876 RepID=UPI00233F5709|nr:hypothetical protein [Vibrio europaeus]MDC5855755.1 hypothetical protein [Vibrio europaeus]